ncbi:MAG: NAD(P)H-binding protein [Betaproteobacteria bacterium]
MVILIAGGSGFLGNRIARGLLAAGHEVISAQRHAHTDTPGNTLRTVAADFNRDTVSDWLPRLVGVDAVINAVGILRERGNQRFASLHVAGPKALFAACAKGGVRRVVQISALGADDQASSGYHLSKKAADDFLLALPLAATVVQPSLVFGPGGMSARLFTALASLPLIPLPGRGEQEIQPIHVDDLVQAIVTLVSMEDGFEGERIALVGPETLSLRRFLEDLRRSLGWGRPRFLRLPMPLVRIAASLAEHLPGSLLDREALAMLERGNTGSPASTATLLGKPPRPASRFVAANERQGARALGRLFWCLPLLRWSVAAVWIVTGIVSLGLFPVAESYALLSRAGITGQAAILALYGAAALDLAFGIGILLFRRRRALWLAQIALVFTYTGIISVYLPEFWLHPYGPILKNLPLLGVLWLLYLFAE